MLTIVFLWILEGMLWRKNLLPGVVMLGAFILCVLYLTGLIESAIQLFGAVSNSKTQVVLAYSDTFQGNVNGNCNTYINSQPSTGVSIETLAWMEQHMICQAWTAQFAFWIVGFVFMIWLLIMASQVNQRFYD